MTNGAQALITTLVDSGVEVCFGNPGTSEMHFVAALDTVPQMRGAVPLRGVVTGAADGYAGSPESRPPLCCIWVPAWVTAWRTCTTLGGLTCRSSTSSATMPPITRSTTRHWNPTSNHWPTGPTVGPGAPPRVRRWAATPRKGGRVAGHSGAHRQPDSARRRLVGRGAEASGPVAPKPAAAPDPKGRQRDRRCAAHRGADRALDRGRPPGWTGWGGRPHRCGHRRSRSGRDVPDPVDPRCGRACGGPTRLPGRAGGVSARRDGHLIVAGTRAPVSFFAYPGKQSVLTPEGAAVQHAGRLDTDVVGALEQLAEVLTGTSPRPADAAPPELPSGGADSPELRAGDRGAAAPGRDRLRRIQHLGLLLPAATAGSPRHDVLTLTGGAIGQGCRSHWAPRSPPRTAR